jgi:hypothetical protein
VDEERQPVNFMWLAGRQMAGDHWSAYLAQIMILIIFSGAYGIVL